MPRATRGPAALIARLRDATAGAGRLAPPPRPETEERAMTPPPARPHLPPLARAVARLGADRIAELEMLLRISRCMAADHAARCRRRQAATSARDLRAELAAEAAAHEAVAGLATQLLDEARATDRGAVRA